MIDDGVMTSVGVGLGVIVVVGAAIVGFPLDPEQAPRPTANATAAKPSMMIETSVFCGTRPSSNSTGAVTPPLLARVWGAARQCLTAPVREWRNW